MTKKYSVGLTLCALIMVALLGGIQPMQDVALAQTGGLLTYGTSVIGSVNTANPALTYTFNGTAGDLVHAQAKGLTGGITPIISLTGPDQQPLANNQVDRLAANRQQAQIALFLPQTGTYTLTVTGTPGTFVLRLSGRGPVAATPLVADQPVPVTIAENAAPQFYSFDAQECPTTLHVVNLAEGQPLTFPFVVKVRNDQGQIAAILRGGVAESDQVTVAPLSGRYEIEVTSVDPLVTGMVSLWVGCAEALADCASPASAAGTGDTGASALMCAPCPECVGDFTPGDGPVCSDMDLRFSEEMEGSLAWNPVEGADLYRIHIYELRGTEQNHIVTLERPRDATSMPIDPLGVAPEMTGFRFVVEAFQGGVVICQDEFIQEFMFEDPVCADFTVRGERMNEKGTEFIEWSWDAYPGADHYVVTWAMVTADGTVIVSGAGTTHETTFRTYWPEVGGVVAHAVFGVQVIQDGRIVCGNGLMLDFGDIATVCLDMNLGVTVLDPATLRTEITWNPVPFTARYELHWYGINADGSEDYFGAVGIAGGDSSYTFEHLPQLGYAGFRFVVEAYALDGTLICQAEIAMMMQEQPDLQPVCDEETFLGGVTEYPDTLSARIGWHPYPDAQGYYVSVRDASGMILPGYPIILSAEQTDIYLDLGEGTFTLVYGPWDETNGILCVREEIVTFGSAAGLPCEISTTRSDVRIHVGPGRLRNVFDYLTPGQAYTVTGQAADDEGNMWWQLDKTQIPGHEAAVSLWVAQLDVVATELCGQMPMVEAPPVIPDGQTMLPQGQWGPCGSCDTCGHTANECVTSPAGECLWDPGHCLEQSGGDGGGDPNCFTLGTAVDGNGIVNVNTGTNCTTSGGAAGYSPGTSVQVSAATNPKWMLDHWSGCGAGGSSNPITITMNGCCTITAHFVIQ